MKIEIENDIECNVLITILRDYESKLKDEHRTDSDEFISVINTIRNSIDSFKIKNTMDFIGPMKCTDCNYRWMAIFANVTEKLECPNCKSKIEIPEHKKLKKQ